MNTTTITLSRALAATALVSVATISIATFTKADTADDDGRSTNDQLRDPWQASRSEAEPTPTEQLALALAKVCVNEAGFNSPADCALVYQVTTAHGRSDSDRLNWLRRHSQCVLRDNPPEADRARGNCSWTWHLQDNNERPANFPASEDWTAYIPRWQRVRALAYRLVSGVVVRRPCRERVVTWGGPMDTAGARRRGLEPVVCGSALNYGFVRVR